MKAITYKTVKVMRTIVASLIILVAFAGITKGENSGKVANEINVIMDNRNESRELAEKMESWISNSAFWNDDTYNKEQELADQMKSWISDTKFWSNEDENSEQGLALQMKSWLSNNAFWNDTEEKINVLAIN